MTLFGLAPSDIPDVQFVDAISPAEAERRLRTAAPEWIEEHYGYGWCLERYGQEGVARMNPEGRSDEFTWDPYWLHVPYDVLRRAFTRDELIRFWFDSSIMSEVDKHHYEDDDVIWKVQNVLWQYGVGRDYKRFIECFQQLRRLSIDLPNFDLRITHTRATNLGAWAWHGRSKDQLPVYLDAALGVLLFYRGEHVLTIGFAVCERGVLVAQVQLREKKGNRFLYKLPMPYLDLALDILRRAFGDELWLIEGVSAVNAVRLAYGSKAGDFTGDVVRIAAFYNQELRDYTRGAQKLKRDNRIFLELHRRHGPDVVEVDAAVG